MIKQKDMPQDISDAILKVQQSLDEDNCAYSHDPICHTNTDVALYSMVTSEDFITYMYTFYNNYNYDDSVVVIKTQVDFKETK